VNTDQGVRAVIKAKPIEPEGVERYLESKFGDALPKTRKAMTELANAMALCGVSWNGRSDVGSL
jgi:hypothetical protein